MNHEKYTADDQHKWKSDFAEEYGIKPSLVDAVYPTAYDEGHSGGYSEIAWWMHTLIEFDEEMTRHRAKERRELLGILTKMRPILALSGFRMSAQAGHMATRGIRSIEELEALQARVEAAIERLGSNQ